MVLVEDSSVILTQGITLTMTIVSLIAVGIKFALSRTHNPRLVALETKVEKYDQEIGDLTQQVSDNKAKILTGIGVAGNVVPQLDAAAKAHDAQIKELQQTIATLQAKLDTISNAVPKS
jgi:prefoldin subunit 5